MNYNANTFTIDTKFASPSSFRKKWNVWSSLAASLALASGAFGAVISGNTYSIGGSLASTVDSTHAQWVTFTASANSTVTEAQIYSAAAITGSPVLQVGLYAVNGSGIPTGSALTTTSITPSGVGWQAATINYSLVQGTVYALQVSTATVGASYAWRGNTNTVANTIQPSGTPDSNWRRGINTGAPVATSQNVWILNTGGNQAIGQPYTSTPFQNLGSTTTAVGERFRFDLPSTGETNLASVNLLLNVAATPPTNPLTVKLLDQNGSVVASGSLDLSTAAAGTNSYQINFGTPYVLTSGSSYYLAVYSNGSLASSVTWEAGATTGSALYESATYEGTSAYAATWNSQTTYGTPATTDLTKDYFFQLNLSAVPEPSTWGLLGLAFSIIMVFVYRQKNTISRP